MLRGSALYRATEVLLPDGRQPAHGAEQNEHVRSVSLERAEVSGHGERDFRADIWLREPLHGTVARSRGALYAL